MYKIINDNSINKSSQYNLCLLQDVFILETGVSLYVWIGHKASRKEKSKAIKDAQVSTYTI